VLKINYARVLDGRLNPFQNIKRFPQLSLLRVLSKL